MTLPRGAIIDRYVVERMLGQGGMADVYLVRHSVLGTQHALKVLHLTAYSIQERLLLEGRVQSRVKSNNIVSVTDVIEVRGAPGLVMDYVEGPSLDDLLRVTDLDLNEADAVAAGLFEGIIAAHSKDLVHRDLKPANVLLAMVDNGLVVKIADFGLAKVLGDEGGVNRTRSGATMGTPAYMSPEQVSDAGKVDQRADLFSLGCILYDLVCGRPPFAGEDTMAIFRSTFDEVYVHPREIVPDLPERMAEAIIASLRADREQRVQTCEALRSLWFGGGPAAAQLGIAPPWRLETLDYAQDIVEDAEPSFDSTLVPASGDTWDADLPAASASNESPLHRPASPTRPIAATQPLPPVPDTTGDVPDATGQVPAPARPPQEDSFLTEPRRSGAWVGWVGGALAASVAIVVAVWAIGSPNGATVEEGVTAPDRGETSQTQVAEPATDPVSEPTVDPGEAEPASVIAAPSKPRPSVSPPPTVALPAEPLVVPPSPPAAEKYGIDVVDRDGSGLLRAYRVVDGQLSEIGQVMPGSHRIQVKAPTGVLFDNEVVVDAARPHRTLLCSANLGGCRLE